jgi:hypothetical protein
MTRSGALLLAVLFVFACRHAVEAEDEPAQARAEEEAPPAPAKQRAGRKSGEVKRPAYPGRPELASDPTALMTPDGAERIQRKLAALGYYSGSGTGRLDEETQDALRRFQAEKKLARTGAPDDATLRALGISRDEVWR